MRRSARTAALAVAAGFALTLAHAPAAGQETGTFVVTQGGSELGTETFTRSGSTLETELTIAGQGTLATTATLGAEATVGRVELRILPPGSPDAEPTQTLAAEFRQDSAYLEQPIGVDAGSTDAAAGTIPYINPSPSYMEQIIRRARWVDGSEVTVQIWVPGPDGGRVTPAHVTFEGDSASLTLGDVTVDITTDADGRLLSAEVPAQGLTIERQ